MTCLIFAFLTWWSFESHNLDRVENAQLQVMGEIETASGDIEESLQRIAQTVDNLSAGFGVGGVPSQDSLTKDLRELLFSDPGYLEAGIAFAPFDYDHSVRLFGLSLMATKEGIETTDLDAQHDYAKEAPDWYRLPMSGGSQWLEPAYDEVTQQMRVTYATPVYGANGAGTGTPIGVIYAVYDVGLLGRILDSIDLGDNGFAYLLSQDGRYFIHPNRDFVGRQISMRDNGSGTDIVARQLGNTVNDLDFAVEIVDPDTGMDAHAFHRSIPTPGWTLGTTLVYRDFHMGPTKTRRTMIQARLLFGAALFFAAVSIMGITPGLRWRVWTLSWIFSILCIGLYWFVIQASIQTAGPEADNKEIITQQYQLDGFKWEQARRTLAQRGELPLFVPTGIYIHSMNFVGPTDLRITGYVWQRYTDGIHDDIERGFIMPESASFEVEQSYSTRAGNDEVVGWNFRATLSEALDYLGYPFGRETLSIQLWHRQFYRNVVLIPDLDAYKDTRPTVKPGLVHGLSILGWTIDSSFFNFKNQSYAADFGLRDFGGLTDFPELFFSVYIGKQIISPFVSNILPLAVVMILLFALLVLGASRQRTRQSGIALDAVAAGGGLFLLVIFSHINLRSNLAAREIFYLEYYYFLVYLIIVGVTINYLLFTKTQMKLVHYKDNLVAKITYWPLTQFAILAFTILEFY